MNFLMNLLKKLKLKSIEINKNEEEIYGDYRNNSFCIFVLENNNYKLVINGKNFDNQNKENVVDLLNSMKHGEI